MPSVKPGAIIEFEYEQTTDEETILYMRLGRSWDSIKYGQVADLVKFLLQYCKDTGYGDDERIK